MFILRITDKKILLGIPEGSAYLHPKKVAGAIYFHKGEKDEKVSKL